MKTIKKLQYIVMLAALMGLASTETKAQKEALNYKVSRTIEEIRDTVTTTGPFYTNLRNSYISIINEGLRDENFDRVLEARDMGWILDNSVIVDESFVDPADYENGIRYGNKIKFQNLQGKASKYLAFVYKGHYIIYAKIACGNPYRKKRIPKDKERTDNNRLATKTDTVYIKTTEKKVTCDCPPGYVKIAVPIYDDCSHKGDIASNNSNSSSQYAYGYDYGYNQGGNGNGFTHYNSGPACYGDYGSYYNNNSSYNSSSSSQSRSSSSHSSSHNSSRNAYSAFSSKGSCDCDKKVIDWEFICVPCDFICPPAKSETKEHERELTWCEKHPLACNAGMWALANVHFEIVYVPDGNGGRRKVYYPKGTPPPDRDGPVHNNPGNDGPVHHNPDQPVHHKPRKR